MCVFAHNRNPFDENNEDSNMYLYIDSSRSITTTGINCNGEAAELSVEN